MYQSRKIFFFPKYGMTLTLKNVKNVFKLIFIEQRHLQINVGSTSIHILKNFKQYS